MHLLLPKDLNFIFNNCNVLGATAMAKALYLARREFTSFSNAARKKRVMLITDGYETEGGKPLLQANLLKTGHRKSFDNITQASASLRTRYVL